MLDKGRNSRNCPFEPLTPRRIGLLADQATRPQLKSEAHRQAGRFAAANSPSGTPNTSLLRSTTTNYENCGPRKVHLSWEPNPSISAGVGRRERRQYECCSPRAIAGLGQAGEVSARQDRQARCGGHHRFKDTKVIFIDIKLSCVEWGLRGQPYRWRMTAIKGGGDHGSKSGKSFFARRPFISFDWSCRMWWRWGISGSLATTRNQGQYFPKHSLRCC